MMGDGAAPRPGGVAERWACLTAGATAGGRLRGARLLDGLALAMDEVLAGGPAPDDWVTAGPIAPPAGDRRAIGDAAAADVRRALTSGAAPDRATALLVWLVKYADVGTPEPLRRVQAGALARRHVRRLLRRALPDVGGGPGDPVGERLLVLLRAARPAPGVPDA
ncbi:hypothetical protein [Miltoncostaea marina]|uniref:hypothetical protein n=1 Tax=Miltoncostaea marina TaxID=2843215 RepID=UPI001C3DA2E2|nr:hypothetical protein [Miltoncostaea marina]